MSNIRHDQYKTQYRAMFVFNCKIKQDEVLKYPLNMMNENREEQPGTSKKKFKKKNFKKEKKEDVVESVDGSSNQNNKLEQADLEQQFDVYKPVVCDVCNVEVGVYDDKDELYHFFNVLASHS